MAMFCVWNFWVFQTPLRVGLTGDYNEQIQIQKSAQYVFALIVNFLI